MHLIAIEGVDGTGKTTLSEMLPHSAAHMGGAPPDSSSAYTHWKEKLERMLHNNPYHAIYEDAVVLERGILSNYIYGNLKKDQKTLTMGEVEDLMRLLCKIFERVDYYLLRACFYDLRERLERKGEKYITPQEAVVLQEKYEELFANLQRFAKGEGLNMEFHIMPKEATLLALAEQITKNTCAE